MPNHDNLRLSHHFVAILGVVVLVTAFVGCGVPAKPAAAPTSGNTGSTIKFSLSPASGTMATGQDMAFAAPFIGPVLWSVNGIPGGSSVVGTIDASGHYTAPLVRPAGAVTLTASLGDAYANPGALSATANVEVINPVPALGRISPDAILVGSAPGQITLTGSGFNPLSQVSLDAEPLTTKFVNPGQLLVDVSASALSVARVGTITVSNASPGGGSSAASLNVLNPAPTIDAPSPQVVIVGSPDALLLISGSGFVPQSRVTVGGGPAPVAFLDPQHLSVSLSASLIAEPGQLVMAVTNPAPGGGVSSSQTITVANPLPVLTALSPTSVLVNAPNQVLKITGSGFVRGSQVLMDGQPVPSEYISATQISATVSAGALTNARLINVSVLNDAPGGGNSSVTAFSVLNPEPSINQISPSATLAGSGPLTVTFSGAGYVPQSGVLAHGQLLVPNWNGSDSLSVTIPAELLATAEQLPITVINPGPGGGPSAEQLFTVLPDGEIQTTGNPQVASYSLTIPNETQLSVEFGEHEYTRTTARIPAPVGGGATRVLVGGMKAASQYHLRGVLTLADGAIVNGPDRTFTTGPLDPNRIPTLVASNTSLPAAGNGVEVLDLVPGNVPNQLRTAVSDLEGNIIWYYDAEFAGAFPFPIRQLPNGNFLVSLAVSGGTGGISKVVREVNLAGETIKELTLDNVNSALKQNGIDVDLVAFHHDAIALANGHWILVGQLYKTYSNLTGLPGETQVIGDVLVDVDESLKPAWFWSAFDHLDVNRHPMLFPDWTHANAVVYDDRDGNLLLSMRHQSWIVKIDYENGKGSGDIIWRLGAQGDFQLSSNNDEGQWFYGQHYPNIVSRNSEGFTIAVMDNGNARFVESTGDTCGSSVEPCSSRAILMHVDEQRRSANVQWAFAPGFFSSWGGSTTQLPNGDFEFDFSQVAPNIFNGSSVYELSNSPQPAVVWQMNLPNSLAYRAFRVPSLYPGVHW